MTSADREFWRGGDATVRIGFDDTGALRFSGYDRAHLDGYEYVITVAVAEFPALRRALGVSEDADVLDAVCAHVGQIMPGGERSWLHAHGIKTQTR